jgi:hypothetical protein
LTTDDGQLLLNGGFDLPQVGRLADKQGAVLQGREKVAIVSLEVVVQILIGVQLQVFATDFHRDDLLIRQRRCKPAPPEFEWSADDTILFHYQTIDGYDKSISIHWLISPVNADICDQLFYRMIVRWITPLKRVAHWVESFRRQTNRFGSINFSTETEDDD